jgi:hypothetical protein
MALAATHAEPASGRTRPHRAEPARATATVKIDGQLYGPRRRFKGVQAGAFELSSFGGCWFANSLEFYRQFERLGLPKPAPTEGLVEYELEFIGRQTLGKRGEFGGYGHLGMWSCQIRAETLISARLLPAKFPAAPPAR